MSIPPLCGGILIFVGSTTFVEACEHGGGGANGMRAIISGIIAHMFTAEMVINAFARNLFFIKHYTQGFSHADALLQPHARGNCANWILGHIATYRNTILEHLGLPPAFDPQTAKRYVANTPPVLADGPDIARFDDILAAIEHAQTQIEAGIRAFDPARAAEMTQFGPREMTRAEAVLAAMRHEALHTGQLELLSELPKG
jgi:uncharacterized damage-inducible protein DinB